jgi:hypothetical protein
MSSRVVKGTKMITLRGLDFLALKPQPACQTSSPIRLQLDDDKLIVRSILHGQMHGSLMDFIKMEMISMDLRPFQTIHSKRRIARYIAPRDYPQPWPSLVAQKLAQVAGGTGLVVVA